MFLTMFKPGKSMSWLKVNSVQLPVATSRTQSLRTTLTFHLRLQSAVNIIAPWKTPESCDHRCCSQVDKLVWGYKRWCHCWALLSSRYDSGCLFWANLVTSAPLTNSTCLSQRLKVKTDSLSALVWMLQLLVYLHMSAEEAIQWSVHSRWV